MCLLRLAPNYAFDLRGRIKVEPKEKIKERLRRSPDRADALALAVGPLLPSVRVRARARLTPHKRFLDHGRTDFAAGAEGRRSLTQEQQS